MKRKKVNLFMNHEIIEESKNSRQQKLTITLFAVVIRQSINRFQNKIPRARVSFLILPLFDLEDETKANRPHQHTPPRLLHPTNFLFVQEMEKRSDK